jgi:hypothetical protein
MRKRVLHAAAIWLAGAALAAIGVTAALSLLGAGVLGGGGVLGAGGGQVLSQADVQRALAQAPPPASAQPSPGPATTPRGHPSGPSPSRLTAPSMFRAAGGTVFASCSAGQATLTSLIPAQGYQTDSDSRGPAASAWVKFQNGGTEQTVTVTCAGDHPRFATPLDGDTGGGGGGGDDHGGGSGDNHGGGGGSGGSGRSAGGGSGGGGGGGGSSGH